jgi:hypothetical protein
VFECVDPNIQYTFPKHGFTTEIRKTVSMEKFGWRQFITLEIKRQVKFMRTIFIHNCRAQEGAGDFLKLDRGSEHITTTAFTGRFS